MQVRGSTWLWNPRQNLPEVQSRAISDHTKRLLFQFLFFKPGCFTSGRSYCDSLGKRTNWQGYSENNHLVNCNKFTVFNMIQLDPDILNSHWLKEQWKWSPKERKNSLSFQLLVLNWWTILEIKIELVCVEITLKEMTTAVSVNVCMFLLSVLFHFQAWGCVGVGRGVVVSCNENGRKHSSPV